MARLGFDMDNVIVQSAGAVVDRAEKHGMDLSDEELKAIAVGIRLNANVENFLDNHMYGINNSLELMPGSVESLEHKRAIGHEAIIVTARSSEIYPNAETGTVKYLEENQIPYDEIFFGVHDKAQFCIEHGITSMLDDATSTVADCQAKNVHGMLFTSDLNAPDEFTPRIDSWEVYDKYIDDFSTLISLLTLRAEYLENS